MKLKPEEETEIKIGMWLKVHGCKFFLNRGSINLMNVMDYNLFKVKGSLKKPDLVFYDPTNKEWNAVELKVGKSGLGIRQSSKIINYYHEYVNNISSYFINKEEIKISNFLVGTFYSPEGKLFLNDYPKTRKNTEGILTAIKFKLIPPFEYVRTADFVRSLWEEWGKKTKNPSVGIGVLLSSCLNFNTNNSQIDLGLPAIFTQQHYKNRWNQKWIIIK